MVTRIGNCSVCFSFRTVKMNTNKNTFKCKRCDKVVHFKQSKCCHRQRHVWYIQLFSLWLLHLRKRRFETQQNLWIMWKAIQQEWTFEKTFENTQILLSLRCMFKWIKCIDLFKKHISYNLVSHLKLQSRWMRKLVLKILLVLATYLINVFHLSKLFNCNKTYSNSLMDILNRISAASPFMAIFLGLISCH